MLRKEPWHPLYKSTFKHLQSTNQPLNICNIEHGMRVTFGWSYSINTSLQILPDIKILMNMRNLELAI